MSNLRIEIFDLNNAALIPTGTIDGVDNFTITYRQDDENGTISASYSSELTFYGDGYTLIYNNLINSPTGFNERLKVNVYDNCCQEAVFTGWIKGDSIDWCETDCSVTVNLVEEDDELACVKNTVIWDNHNGFLGRNYFPVRYCIENRPLFIQVIISYLVLVVYGVYSFIVTRLIIIIRLICGLINGAIRLFGGDPIDCGIVDILEAPMDELGEIIVPCGFFHPSPYIRDYINNVCQKCGLTFQSSIFNQNNYGGDYYWSVMMSGQVKKGKDPDSTDYRLIGDNLPVETLELLFNNYLNPIFNAKWVIYNSTLIFERKDYFLANSQWLDANQLLANGKIIDNKICWSWIEDPKYAYGRYEWSRDAAEYVGNEAFNRFNDIVEWNVPYSSAQTGEKTTLIQASPSRFQRDGVEFSIRDTLGNIGNQVLDVITRGLWLEWDYLMIMAQHTPFNYKFLRIEPGSNGEVRRDYSDAYCGGYAGNTPHDKRYNYPFWFQEKEGNDPLQNNLYTRFHYIDNPRLPGTTKYNFDFKFRFDCSEFTSFSFAKYVKLRRGSLNLNGQVTEIEVDFNNRIIAVKGKA